jgi:hypothetical protein
MLGQLLSFLSIWLRDARPTTFHALGSGSIFLIFLYFMYFVANAFRVVTCAATSDVPYTLTAIESNSEEKDVAPQLKTRCKLALRG